MKIKFSELALDQSIEIYESLEKFKEGLGERFYDKLKITYDLIKINKAIYQSLEENSLKRRAILKLTSKLHFRLIYEVFPDYIEIQALVSTYRKN